MCYPVYGMMHIKDSLLLMKKSSPCNGQQWVSGARCSSMVRAFAHGAMGRWIDPSWGGPIELSV